MYLAEKEGVKIKKTKLKNNAYFYFQAQEKKTVLH